MAPQCRDVQQGARKRTTTPYDLHDAFPDAATKIRALKAADVHFARLVADYDAVNGAVHAAESLVRSTDEAHESDLRRRRLQLKDEIRTRLQEG